MKTAGKNSSARRHGERPMLFISYRRRTDFASARLLRQDLVKEFGDEAVFRDVERIGGGEKFAPQIHAALETCNTFLALISNDWLEAAGRLHEAEDFVRMEIAAALRSDVRVLPLLLNGAQMPSKKDLPADIREFTDYQAEELRDTRWEDDVRHLIEVIRAPFPDPQPSHLGKLGDAARRLAGTWYDKAALAALAALVLLGAAVLVWFGPLKPSVRTNSGASLTTPTPDAFPTPAPPPAATPTPLTKCFRGLLPPGRWIEIQYGDPDERVVVRREQPKDAAAGILLKRGGREVGAVRFRFLRYGKDAAGNDSGYYEIEQFVGPDCRPVEGYAQAPDGGEPAGRRNYEWLEQIPLGGGRYDLRIAYANETVIAVFRRKPY